MQHNRGSKLIVKLNNCNISMGITKNSVKGKKKNNNANVKIKQP